MNTPIDETESTRPPEAFVEVSDDTDREFTEVVVSTIAEQLETDPTELPPIDDSIDPDLLNEFQQEAPNPLKTLSFEYAGYDILVTSDNAIQIHAQE